MHCFHCNAVIPPSRRVTGVIEGIEHDFCCHGCLTVARLTSQDDIPKAVPAETMGTAHLDITGMTCANCARAIELGLQKLDGILESRIDVVARRLHVSWEASRMDFDTISVAIQKLGYGVSKVDTSDTITTNKYNSKQQDRRRLQRLLLAWLGMMQIMMLSVPVYLAGAHDIEPDIAQLLRIAQLVIAMPVMLFSAWPIYQAAWRDLKARQIGMEVPVTAGLAVAAGASLVAVLRADGVVYFDSITMFVALLLGSRWLQERGLKRASEYLNRLSQTHRPKARRILGLDHETEMVDAAHLSAGDLIQVRPGETFPADGVVVSGTSLCSEALLTGESKPVSKQPDDPVLASSNNLEQALVVRVTHAGEQTALAALTRLTEAASRVKPALVQFSDQAARWFIVLIGLVVIGAALAWSQIDPSRIVPVTIAILIVTCPCALSLAVPMALAAAQASLARHGILVTRSAAIETMGKVDHMVFDKTGTLTMGQMQLVDLVILRPLPNTLWQEQSMDERNVLLLLATALELNSNHPIANALRAAVPDPVTLPVLSEVKLFNGLGVEGTIENHRLRFGQVDFALGFGRHPKQDGYALLGEKKINHTCSISLLADHEGPLALFYFSDPIRPDALALIESLHKKIPVSMLSGDRQEAVSAVALALEIEDARAACTPTDKRNAVSERQQRGEIVAMVGDGLNDAPVIAQADVSAAFASASTLAQTQADFIVLSDRLSGLSTIFETSRRSLRIIRQNLGWALLYNLIAIPVAAGGMVSPAWASVGMATSSLLVVGNSLRLLPRSQKL